MTAALPFGPWPPGYPASAVTFAAVKAALAAASSPVGFNSQPLTGVASVNGLALSLAASNVKVGTNAGGSISTGDLNTQVGVDAAKVLSTGSGNTSSGWSAAVRLTTGSNNVSIGSNASQALVAGNFNVSIGSAAGASAHDLNDNVCIGRDSGLALNSDFNICIGSGVSTPDPATSGEINIGNVFYAVQGTKRVRIGTVGAGALPSAGGATATFVEAGADTVPVLALLTLGTNPGVVRIYAGNRNPNAAVSANAGSIYLRQSAAASAIYINRSAADPGTAWSLVTAVP